MLQLASRNLLHPLARPDFGEEIIGAVALEYQAWTATLVFFHRTAHQQALAGCVAQDAVIRIRLADGQPAGSDLHVVGYKVEWNVCFQSLYKARQRDQGENCG